MNQYFLNFNETKKNQQNIIGGKGSNLSFLYKKKFNVPDGFIVTTNIFDLFMDHNNLKFFQNRLNDLNTLIDKLKLAETLRKKIINGKIPEILISEINNKTKEIKHKKYAVRSSATIEDGVLHSFAGQFESYLNVDRKKVLKKTILCFASFFSPRVIIYTHRKNISLSNAKMAVVIHKMVNPLIAGNLFTTNFLNKNNDQVLIETVFGSGEKVTDGTGDTRRIIVNKKNQKIINIEAERMINKQIFHYLVKTSMEIEQYFNRPQEIEWAFDGKDIYIIQSRPISFINKNTY